MYRNAFWFGLGYITCKRVVPILSSAIIKAHAQLKEDGVL